jgi:hypothetical protein
VWASAAEGHKLADEITAMVEEIRQLGPLNWASTPNGDGARVTISAEAV